MKILIGADIVPTATNQHFFEQEEMEKIVDGDLYEVLNKADYRVFNLEVPLTDTEAPIEKCGPNLIASAESAAGLKQLGIDFLTLANNHILDQGTQGLRSTTEQLDRAGIAYAGVGNTPAEAARPHIAEIEGKKVGIYCCAEHEFSIVSDKQAGANPFNPLETPDHIAALKERCDYVICLYHGGKEHYRYPSPNLQKVCRKLVEKGADLVVCQHSHCIGCEEKWQNGTIVYGQGNFLFDHSKSEYWQTSVLVQVDLQALTVEYIPIQKNGNAVKLAKGEDAQEIISAMQARTKQIEQKEFVESSYEEFAVMKLYGYFYTVGGFWRGLLFKVINRVFRKRPKITHWYGKKKLIEMINCIDCEAHRELLLKGLETASK